MRCILESETAHTSRSSESSIELKSHDNDNGDKSKSAFKSRTRIPQIRFVRREIRFPTERGDIPLVAASQSAEAFFRSAA